MVRKTDDVAPPRARKAITADVIPLRERPPSGKASAVTAALRARRAPGRPSRLEGEALMQGMLDAALQTFIDRGFEAASMEGIARAARVAKITLYRHFETKEQLFVEVARRAQLDVRHRLGTVADEDLSLSEALRTIIEKLYDGYTHPDYLAVMRLVIAEARRFPMLGRTMIDDSAQVTEPLVAYLQRLKDRGQIEIDSAYDAATQICGLASGAGRYVLLTPSRHPASRKRWVASLVTLFVRAWAVPRR